MKILLNDDVPGVGDMGQLVTVRPGYARNYLIPRGFAIEAEGRAASALTHKARQIEKKKRELKGDAEKLAEKLQATEVVVGLRVSSSGIVFGSIRAKDIADRLSELGFSIDRRRVMISEPIKAIGEHKVKVKLHPELSTQLNITVQAQSMSKEEEEAEAEAAKKKIEEKVSAAREE